MMKMVAELLRESGQSIRSKEFLEMTHRDVIDLCHIYVIREKDFSANINILGRFP